MALSLGEHISDMYVSANKIWEKKKLFGRHETIVDRVELSFNHDPQKKVITISVDETTNITLDYLSAVKMAFCLNKFIIDKSVELNKEILVDLLTWYKYKMDDIEAENLKCELISTVENQEIVISTEFGHAILIVGSEYHLTFRSLEHFPAFIFNKIVLDWCNVSSLELRNLKYATIVLLESLKHIKSIDYLNEDWEKLALDKNIDNIRLYSVLKLITLNTEVQK